MDPHLGTSEQLPTSSGRSLSKSSPRVNIEDRNVLVSPLADAYVVIPGGGLREQSQAATTERPKALAVACIPLSCAWFAAWLQRHGVPQRSGWCALCGNREETGNPEKTRLIYLTEAG